MVDGGRNRTFVVGSQGVALLQSAAIAAMRPVHEIEGGHGRIQRLNSVWLVDHYAAVHALAIIMLRHIEAALSESYFYLQRVGF